MSASLRRIGLATIALVTLTVAFCVTNARTATVAQGSPPGATALPIGIVDLMKSAKDLPVEQYDAL